MRRFKLVVIFLFLILFCSSYAQKIDKIGFEIDRNVASECFKALKNISSTYEIEIPLKNYNEFEEKATLYFTRSNIDIYTHLKIGEGLYYWLVYQFGSNTTLQEVFDIFQPKENIVIFYYDSTGFEGCGITQIKRGNIKNSRPLIKEKTLIENGYKFALAVFEKKFKKPGYYGKLIILEYKSSKLRKIRAEYMQKRKITKIVFLSLPIIIVLLLIYLYMKKRKRISEEV